MEAEANPYRLNRDDLILRFYRVIPSTPEAVDEVLIRIMAIAKDLECAPGELDKVGLALKEALNNAVLHGNKSDPSKKVAVCCLCAEDKGILLVVRDGGEGFDPEEIPDPTNAERIYSSHGRGIFLMRQLMDEVRFEDGGRTILMRKDSAKKTDPANS